jgi:hypothetical protein
MDPTGSTVMGICARESGAGPGDTWLDSGSTVVFLGCYRW